MWVPRDFRVEAVSPPSHQHHTGELERTTVMRPREPRMREQAAACSAGGTARVWGTGRERHGGI